MGVHYTMHSTFVHLLELLYNEIKQLREKIIFVIKPAQKVTLT